MLITASNGNIHHFGVASDTEIQNLNDFYRVLLEFLKKYPFLTKSSPLGPNFEKQGKALLSFRVSIVILNFQDDLMKSL